MEKTKEKKYGFMIAAAVLAALFSAAVIIIASRPPKVYDYNDLTKMNGNMTAIHINQMHNLRPGAYLGKTIRLSGEFSCAKNSNTGEYCYFVVVKDAIACCAQGVEFKYCGEYPEGSPVITIEGIFKEYSFSGKSYYYIEVSELIIQ